MRAVIGLAALTIAAAAYGQAYKWVDEGGKVRYGDMPPPGVRATPLKPPPAGRPPAASTEAKKDNKAGDKELTPEAAFRKRQQERQDAEQKAEKERADAEKKQQNCANAQTYLRTLQSGQRITSTDAAGERTYMDDDQRRRAVDQAQRSVSEWCK